MALATINTGPLHSHRAPSSSASGHLARTGSLEDDFHGSSMAFSMTLDSSSSGSSDEDEDRTHRSTRKQPRNQHTSNYGSSSRLHVHQLPASASLPLTNGRRRPSDSRRSSNSSSSSGDDDEEEEGQDDEGANSSEQCLLIEHQQQSLQPCRLTASSPLSAFFGGSYQASAAAAVTAAAAAAAVAVSSGPSGKMLLDVPSSGTHSGNRVRSYSSISNSSNCRTAVAPEVDEFVRINVPQSHAHPRRDPQQGWIPKLRPTSFGMTLTETYAFDSGRARWRVRLGKLVENQAVLTATVCTLFFVQLVATFLVLSSCDATTAPVLDSLSFAASCVCVGALCLMALQLSLLVVAFDLRFFFHLGYLLDVIIVALASAYAINDYSFVGCLFLVAGAWRILPLACAIVDKRRSNVLPSSALGAVSTGSLISDDDLSFQIQRLLADVQDELAITSDEESAAPETTLRVHNLKLHRALEAIASAVRRHIHQVTYMPLVDVKHRV